MWERRERTEDMGCVSVCVCVCVCVCPSMRVCAWACVYYHVLTDRHRLLQQLSLSPDTAQRLQLLIHMNENLHTHTHTQQNIALNLTSLLTLNLGLLCDTASVDAARLTLLVIKVQSVRKPYDSCEHQEFNLSVPFSHLSRSNVTPSRPSRHLTGREHTLYFYGSLCVCVWVGEGVTDREEQKGSSYSYSGDGSINEDILRLQLFDISRHDTAVAIAGWNTVSAIAFLQKWSRDSQLTIAAQRREAGRRQIGNLLYKVRKC